MKILRNSHREMNEKFVLTLSDLIENPTLFLHIFPAKQKTSLFQKLRRRTLISDSLSHGAVLSEYTVRFINAIHLRRSIKPIECKRTKIPMKKMQIHNIIEIITHSDTHSSYHKRLILGRHENYETVSDLGCTI